MKFDGGITDFTALRAELVCPFRVVLFDDGGARIEGHKGVSFWDGNGVIFRRKNGTVSLVGEGLEIKEISPGEAYVAGRIKNVTLEVKSRKVDD